jgi:hypothetical protein
MESGSSPAAGSGFHIAYAIRRDELWRWYWRAWRRKLWILHLLVVVVIGAEFYAASPTAPVTTGVLIPTLIFALPAIAIMIAYPQIRFKPETRTLTMSAEGLATTIKGKTRKFSWTKFRSVTEADGYLVIETKMMNLLIVPPRAFPSLDDRAAFAAFAINALDRKQR